ncbi:hypothetical protein NHX12_031917 [Muraenolepis orangiensis]|uniref:Uncharacterized protein n=1 Tax=Muraenolepis orangiensis TaxID=630683 RepID=A0A9Q0E6H7_9TELE|nr:hypothetical protein NHX12_031917 [Muraenolepis orangiensis]
MALSPTATAARRVFAAASQSSHQGGGQRENIELTFKNNNVNRMGDLSDFLRQRDVSEETIETLEHEKIDASTIQLMTDEDLKTYFPSYGDRLAVLGFCRRKENIHKNTRKSQLFERLKTKLAK